MGLWGGCLGDWGIGGMSWVLYVDGWMDGWAKFVYLGRYLVGCLDT